MKLVMPIPKHRCNSCVFWIPVPSCGLEKTNPDIHEFSSLPPPIKTCWRKSKPRRFREDLYYRLNALGFQIPSLNDRQEDIGDLAIHFLGRLHQAYKKDSNSSPPQFDRGAIDFLTHRVYRGNVRELKNLLLRALLFCNIL